jgi:hypothetical protein
MIDALDAEVAKNAKKDTGLNILGNSARFYALSVQ